MKGRRKRTRKIFENERGKGEEEKKRDRQGGEAVLRV